MGILYQKLCEIQTLHNAWKNVRQKNSAGGVDGLTVLQFEENLGDYLNGLRQELLRGEWAPEPYLRVEIRKNEFERRKLGMLSIKDKIVQQAIKNLIEPRFENLFLGNSYGYRPERGATRAIRRALVEFQTKKNNWVLKLDIDDYFDSINHELLFLRLGSFIKDEEIVRLIELCVKMGVVTKRLKWKDIKRGIPQGAVMSPLLANFYLHPFDEYIVKRAKAYVRYADDFLIWFETKNQAERVCVQAGRFLTEQLLLSLNKPVLEDVNTGTDFLGVFLKRGCVLLTKEKRELLHERIHSIAINGTAFTKKSKDILRGIHSYYGQLLPQDDLLEFDHVLLDHLKGLIKGHWRAFKGRETLEKLLKEIPLLADDNKLKRRQLIYELLEYYSELKKLNSAAKKDVDLNKQLIERKKREYHRKEGEGAEYVISSYGCFIGVSNKGLTIKQKGKVINDTPSIALKHLTVMSGAVSISSNAIQYCMKNKIPIDFFDGMGKHYGSILSPVFIENTLWRKQGLMSNEQRSLLGMKIIYGKLKNQLNLIKYFHKYHKGTANALTEKYADVVSGLESIISSVKGINLHEEYADNLRMLEASGAVLYWDYIRQLVADDGVDFASRERKGATDLMNSMLNYGYAILYVRVWQALLLAKLNPMESVIHVRQPGKPTFVYDVIELFRAQAVDRVVISMIQKGKALTMDKELLSESTKQNLLQNLLERLNRYEKYRGEERKFCRIIQLQAKEIAAYVDEGSNYKPYIAKW